MSLQPREHAHLRQPGPGLELLLQTRHGCPQGKDIPLMLQEQRPLLV